MKTCGDCLHFEHLGEGKNGKGEPCVVGHCFGMPPQITVQGASSYPVVALAQRECHIFKPKLKGKTK